MQITRETDYAIRCVLHLAMEPGRTFMVDDISDARGIPRSFLAKILQKLKRDRLVRSYRGVKGGFRLALPPEQISILDVVRSIQGGVPGNICAVDASLCDRSSDCAVHFIWKDVRDMLEDKLTKYNFKDLAEREGNILGSGE